jgi:hypothetical protein
MMSGSGAIYDGTQPTEEGDWVPQVVQVLDRSDHRVLRDVPSGIGVGGEFEPARVGELCGAREEGIGGLLVAALCP